MAQPPSTAEDIVSLQKTFDNLCKGVLGHGQGKELLAELKRIYCDGRLYQDTDRETVYCIAQRDLILELTNKVNENG